jgi:hypothetical protein
MPDVQPLKIEILGLQCELPTLIGSNRRLQKGKLRKVAQPKMARQKKKKQQDKLE